MPSSVWKDDPLQLLRFIFFRLKDAYVMGRSPLFRETPRILQLDEDISVHLQAHARRPAPQYP